MKYYRPGMISMVFIPLLLIPFLYSEFHRRDFRYIKFNLPEKECEEGQICFDISSLYKGLKFDTLYLEQINELSISEKFENFSNKIRVDSVNGSFKNTKGLIFKLTTKTEYQKIVFLLNNCLKYKLSLYALDNYNNQFVLQPALYTKEDLKLTKGMFDCISISPEPGILTKIRNYFSNLEYPFDQKWVILILVFYLTFALFSVVMFFKNPINSD